MNPIVARLTLCVSLITICLIFTGQTFAEFDPEIIAGMWLFDDGKGKEAKDSSGNGFDGELKENPLWVDGKFGTGRQLPLLNHRFRRGL